MNRNCEPSTMIAPTRPAIAPLANMVRTAFHPRRPPASPLPGEARLLPRHPQFVTCARPPVDESDGERDRRDEETADVERSGQNVKARVRRDHESLRQSGRNVAKGKAREVGCDADRRV